MAAAMAAASSAEGGGAMAVIGGTGGRPAPLRLTARRLASSHRADRRDGRGAGEARIPPARRPSASASGPASSGRAVALDHSASRGEDGQVAPQAGRTREHRLHGWRPRTTQGGRKLKARIYRLALVLGVIAAAIEALGAGLKS